MTTIWKFPLSPLAKQIVLMPPGAKVIHVSEQYDFACLWAEVEPGTGTEDRTFYIVGTGMQVPDGVQYVGTAHSGSFVWHIYEDASL